MKIVTTAVAAAFVLALSAGMGSAALYQSDFELNDGGLAGDGDWEWGTPIGADGSALGGFDGPEPVGGNSGENAWGTVIGGLHSPSLVSTLTLGGLDLTGATELSFFEWIDSGGNSFDTAKVFVGLSEVYLSNGNSSQSWREVTLDLSPFSGVQPISWVFSATSVVERVGWYLDDVTVSGVSGPSEIPLPPAAVLLIGALGALGLGARRARA